MQDDTTAATAPRSLDEFFIHVEVSAFRMAQVALGNRDDALDAVQDAMERLLKYRHRPGAEWPPLFWSILRRRLTDRHRGRSLQRRVLGWLHRPSNQGADDEGAEALPAAGGDPGQTLDDERAMAQLSAALDRLPNRQREAFLLRVLQGLDVATTAVAMGCGEGSVKTHLSRAMMALREKLEEWR